MAPQVEHAARIVLDNPDNEVESSVLCLYVQSYPDPFPSLPPSLPLPVSSLLPPLLSSLPFSLLFVQAAKEHYQKLKEEYEAQVNKLTGQVEANLDTVEFLEASEDHLRETLEAAKALIKTGKEPQVK